MTFDEFLLSDEKIKDFNGTTIVKLNYNDKIDFLYEPSYFKLELDRDLKFIGIYDKVNQKTYSSDNSYILEYKEALHSEFYNGNVSKIYKQVIDELNNRYKKYIEENQESLIVGAENIFKNFIENSTSIKILKDRAITNYIYNNEVKKNNYKIEFEAYREDYKNIILEYIQEPKSTIDRLYDEYINKEFESYITKGKNINQKEYIGFMMQQDKYLEQLTNEISENPSDEQKKKHDIVQAIDKLDAQMVTVTIEKNNKRVSFKYPKDQVYSFYFSSWKIPDVKIREEIEGMYDRWCSDKEIFNDIISISYRGKPIYEYKEFEKKNELEESEEEMFD